MHRFGFVRSSLFSLPRRARAFSLTELLVVVAIIAVLLAFLTVGVEVVQTHAVSLKCQHHLEQIGHAWLMYSSRFQGAVIESVAGGSGQIWFDTLSAGKYVSGTEVLRCPSVEGAPMQTVQQPSNIPAGTLEALRWLKRHQDGTGRWTHETSRGAHNAATALSLLVFLTAGCTDNNPPEFAGTTKKAVEYLVSQNDAGSFRRGSAEQMYSQGMCVMALAEAARRVEKPNLKDAARRAAQDGVNYIANKQSATAYGGFTYGGGGQDMSVSGWNLQAIRSAMDAGLTVPDSSGPSGSNTQAFFNNTIWTGKSKCISGLYDCTNSSCPWYGPDTGIRGCTSGIYVCAACGWKGTTTAPADNKCSSCGATVAKCSWYGAVGLLVGGKCPKCNSSYVYGRCPSGHNSAYLCAWGGDRVTQCPVCRGAVQNSDADYGTGYQYAYAPWKQGRTVRLTAAALTCRRLLGRPADASDCQGQLQWLISNNYMKYATTNITDLYTVYYITLAMYQMGDSHWTNWSTAFRTPLESKQILTEGDNKGSWPEYVFGYDDTSRTLNTAVACLCLRHMLPHYWAQGLALGQASYGYNNRLGKTRGTPGGDTIVVLDYSHWEIDHDGINKDYDDDLLMIALRHGGRANALMGDGSVRSFRPEQIKSGMWSPEPGD